VTRRALADRLAHLQAKCTARIGTRLDADLPAHLPAWGAHLTDAELAPADPVERLDDLAIEATCKARGAA
jgi:hypothetical protein